MTSCPQGFVDLHTHGIGRHDTRTGKTEDILEMASLHGLRGTAAILPTIYPGPIVQMRRQMEAVGRAMAAQLAEAKDCEGGRPKSALILGVNLEGPFLNSLRSGALDKAFLLKPSLPALKSLIGGYEGIIKVITIAPELSGALKLIDYCAGLGIRVNMGHSDAAYRQALEGKKAGATGITHLFNAMRPFHHREPGLVGLGLIDEDLYVEVIADGVHLHPAAVELIFSKKRLDRIILVSDSVKGTGKGKALFLEDGTLAGGGLTLSGATAFLKKIGVPDAEITEASIDSPIRYLKGRR